jgi:hypothetical protein
VKAPAKVTNLLLATLEGLALQLETAVERLAEACLLAFEVVVVLLVVWFVVVLFCPSSSLSSLSRGSSGREARVSFADHNNSSSQSVAGSWWMDVKAMLAKSGKNPEGNVDVVRVGVNLTKSDMLLQEWPLAKSIGWPWTFTVSTKHVLLKHLVQ